ncbi:pyrroline-5-carboxylate reductase [Apiospora saccharicola]|uniref:Pyrroline-5-carboxylate reductase n=1 Tax=Apiospora saccharicola TaxID=335842 RepID=A0ABR1U6B1_9PEZI
MSVPDRLTFIGGGHLAQAVISGIYSSNVSWKDACPISVTGRRTEHAEQLGKSYPKAFVTTHNLHPNIWAGDNLTAHVVFICTRPKEVPQVCQEIASTLETLEGSARPTVVTMCPGISVAQLQNWLPKGTPIVRSMPNLPVTCREGATALFASEDAVSRVELVASVLREVSPAVSVLPEESLLDVAASISGSAPAYFYYLIESLVAAAETHGMSTETARNLVTQSCLGSGMLSRDTDRPIQVLRKEVCVPGGSTEKAVAHLMDSRMKSMVQGAVDKSLQANREMRYVEKKKESFL